ncbi:MAG: hypothetical protein GXP55_07175 [Deltaproteobacteria bacterium]|nr:hypothetical protein [Deltaproteobacteria bacterium]
MTRIYDTSDYKKHKRPKGWGSLCPDDTLSRAQNLLDSGASVGDAVFNVEGELCYRAQSHAERDGATYWHGHPIPWTRLPPSAKNALVASGRLDLAVYRKAIRKSWGREFDR